MLVFSILNHPFSFMVDHFFFVFFYLSELVFSGFFKFKANSVRGQNDTKYRD